MSRPYKVRRVGDGRSWPPLGPRTISTAGWSYSAAPGDERERFTTEAVGALLKTQLGPATVAVEELKDAVEVLKEGARDPAKVLRLEHAHSVVRTPQLYEWAAEPSSGKPAESSYISLALTAERTAADVETAVYIFEQTIDMGEVDEEKLTAFVGLLGACLHRLLVTHQNLPSSSEEASDVGALTLVAVEELKARPLTRLLYSLATGSTQPPAAAPADAWAQRSVLGPKVASDILRSIANVNSSQQTQRLVGNLLQNGDIPTTVRDMLTRLVIAASRPTIVNAQSRGILDLGDPLAGVARDSFLIMMYDNVGFKKRAAYEQFVLVMIQVVPWDMLVKMGIIAKSNEPRSLGTELPNSQAYLPQDHDYAALSHLVKARLCSLVALYLPDATAATVADIFVEGDAPRASRAQLDEEADEAAHRNALLDAAVAQRDLEHGAAAVDGKFDQNEGRVIMDRPLNEDLNRKDVVWQLLSRLHLLRDGQRDDGAGDGDDGEPPRDHGLGCAFSGDGSPMAMALDLLRENAETLTPGEIITCEGGFHFEKELWTALGKLYGPALLRYACRYLNRTGQKAQDWVLFPGNPKQAREEWEQFLMGLYYEAVCATRDACDREHVTTAEVHKLMLKRAGAEPTVLLVVSWMRFVEVALGVFDSKRIGTHGDYALFRSMRSLALLLFSITNCYHYVNLATHGMEQWAEASDRLRQVMSDLLFTKQSSTGRGLAMIDEFVEWVVRDVRALLGKQYSHGRTPHIMRTIMLLPKLIACLRAKPGFTEPARAVPNENRPSRTFSASSQAFKGGIRFAKDHNLWGDGPVKRRTKPSSDKFVDVVPGAFVSLDAGFELNPSLLLLNPMAKTRLTAFVDERRGGFRAGPAPRPVPAEDMTKRFSMPACALRDIAEQQKFFAARSTSVSVHECMGRYDGVLGKGEFFLTMEVMHSEIKEWRDVVDANYDDDIVTIPDVSALRAMDKGQLVETLVALRTEMFRRQEEPRDVARPPAAATETITLGRNGDTFSFGHGAERVIPVRDPFFQLPGIDEN